MINGELVPYEKGYKPPAAIPVGELVYASQITGDENQDQKPIGPYSKEDNYKSPEERHNSLGPFTVKDNTNPKTEENFVKFSSASGFGPFTKDDNKVSQKINFLDYIKEVNKKEAKKNYNTRHYRAYESMESQGSDYYPIYTQNNDFGRYEDYEAAASTEVKQELDPYDNQPNNQFQRRMLTYPNSQIHYPPSEMYSPPG